MYPVSKILVAIDFSEHSRSSLRYAADLAKSFGASLLLVNVINQRDLDAFAKAERLCPGFDAQARLDEVKQDRRTQFIDLIADVGCSKLKPVIVVRTGVPHEILLEEIAEKKPNLLIMATKGRSNLADTIIGSCAQKMFRRSPIPLLSLRPESVNQ